MTAHGFIETRGLLATVVALDAMVKTAEVELVDWTRVGGGLVTVIVAGEVSAVRAAVDAGSLAVQGITGARLIRSHVIARPYAEVGRLLKKRESGPGHPVDQEGPAPVQDGAGVEAKPGMALQKPAGGGEDEAGTGGAGTAEPSDAGLVAQSPSPPSYDQATLREVTLSRLREIALSLDTVALSPEQIKRATRKKLIDAIVKATNRERSQ